MASSFCTKCGAPAISGKRFCTQCGQPIVQTSAPTGPAATISDHDPVTQPSVVPEVIGMVTTEPPPRATAPKPAGKTQAPIDPAALVEAALPLPQKDRLAESAAAADVIAVSGPLSTTPSALADTFCTKCGSPVPAGKRFCTKCGQPNPESAAKTENTNTVARSESPNLNPSESIAALAVEASPKADVPGPVEDAQVPKAYGVCVGTPLSSPQREYSFEEAFASANASESTVGAGVVQPLAPTVDDPSSSVFLAPDLPVQKRSFHLPVLLVGAAACVLVIVMMGVWLHTSRAKSASPADPVATATTIQSAPPALNDSAVVNDKPSGVRLSGEGAAAPRHVENEVLQTVAPAHIPGGGVAKVTASNKSSTEVMTANIRKNPASGPAEAVIKQSSPEPGIAPAPQTSGTLHYSGPPVRYGESIAFTLRTTARLKFAFDHQAWQPLISRQQDGTMRLVLRSLKAGEQKRCEVGWEVVSEPVAGKPVEKATGKCELLPNDMSSYLDRADTDRAAGRYEDAARQYSKVIACDPYNARAQQGSARTRQAQAVSGGD